MFSDENRYVRGDAVHALYRIGTPEAKEVAPFPDENSVVPRDEPRKYALEASNHYLLLPVGEIL